MSKPIAFIIGAGKNIGFSTADVLRSKGYQIALAARSFKHEESKDGTFYVNVDLSKPDTVNTAFASVRKHLGEPSVVLYNAAAAHFTKPDDPLSPSVDDFANDLTINTTSLYAATKEALASFDASLASSSKTFLYTGNILNERPMPPLLTLGVGKVASSQIIELASGAYGQKGYKFYYVDERKADGSSKGEAIDGPAHGEFIASLIEGKGEVPWQATFVAGKGYVKFPYLRLA